jgi:hypothetical protein
VSALLAVDPGTEESGWVELNDNRTIGSSGVDNNAQVLDRIRRWGGDLAIEMIASYGMPVGREVFETCVWIGRAAETYDYSWRDYGTGKPRRQAEFVYRRDVKLHLCGSSRAKDANIRQALIDIFGPPGTVKAKGPTYGVKSHAWAALGVAATVRRLEAPKP